MGTNKKGATYYRHGEKESFPYNDDEYEDVQVTEHLIIRQKKVKDDPENKPT